MDLLLIIESTRKHTRIAVNPLSCYMGWGDRPEAFQFQKDRRNNKIDEHLIANGYNRDRFLMFSPSAGTKYHDESIEGQVQSALISVCPKLRSSRTLQDMAFRVVMSIGHDACVVDSDVSASLGKLSLKAKDILSPKESDGVFGQFQIIPNFLY